MRVGRCGSVRWCPGVVAAALRPEPTALLRTQNRYRDLVVDPGRRTLYVATDPSGLASTDAGAPTTTLANPGAILAFTYRPSRSA